MNTQLISILPAWPNFQVDHSDVRSRFELCCGSIRWRRSSAWPFGAIEGTPNASTVSITTNVLLARTLREQDFGEFALLLGAIQYPATGAPLRPVLTSARDIATMPVRGFRYHEAVAGDGIAYVGQAMTKNRATGQSEVRFRSSVRRRNNDTSP